MYYESHRSWHWWFNSHSSLRQNKVNRIFSLSAPFVLLIDCLLWLEFRRTVLLSFLSYTNISKPFVTVNLITEHRPLPRSRRMKFFTHVCTVQIINAIANNHFHPFILLTGKLWSSLPEPSFISCIWLECFYEKGIKTSLNQKFIVFFCLSLWLPYTLLESIGIFILLYICRWVFFFFQTAF